MRVGEAHKKREKAKKKGAPPAQGWVKRTKNPPTAGVGAIYKHNPQYRQHFAPSDINTCA